ncbi:Signal peptidase-like protein [Lunatimonas lonarensis]|uniref:Signal peptidase-like protein n=2 Tax=Lunatimonas lonarensis TaxID=1232681 RepID=R7ZS20_9BACT|nr:Signal peptidase-like protein [Lunatimonas lonarensis]
MGLPEVDRFDIVEVKFKGGRKEYFRNVDYLHLTTGDPVVVDVPNGHHIGFVSLQGELVRLQMQKRKVKNDDNILRIYRVANQKDLDKWQEAKNRELPTLYRSKQIIDELGLKMKLSDVEYQSDNSKATFYYSADDRVDFRELIKMLAAEFKIRVEMRQISLRQEAGRLGGIGVCGRELCCSTWIHDFKSVTTSAARYQNLSLNPSKLSGQCGRLKCCLNYELDSYMSALKDIPQVDKPLLTESGNAKLQKTDIFRKLMWFSYNDDNNWHSIDCERVAVILEMNSQGKIPFNLKQDTATENGDVFENSNKDLEMLDKKFSQAKKKKKRKPKKPETGEKNTASTAAPTLDQSANTERPARSKRPNRNQRRPKPGTQPTASGSTPPVTPTEGGEARRKKRRNNQNRRKGNPGSQNNTGPNE